MITRTLEGDILNYLYCKSFGEGHASLDGLDRWAVQRKINKIVFWEEYDQLVKKNFVQFNQDDAVVRFTPKGVLHTEKEGFAPLEMVSKHRHIRQRLLNALAMYLNRSSPTVTLDEITTEACLPGTYCLGDIELLIDLGYIRWIVPRVNLSINAKVCAKQQVLSKTR